MVAGQLRVAVIGSQTCHADSPLAYTVYRTSCNYRGLCYHRLIRFRHFSAFAKKLRLAPDAPRISVKLPPKIWWSRKASLRPETVEERQVLLNEYMQQVCSRPLTSRSEQRLLKLLQLGDFAPKEEEDRVVNSRLSSKQQSATPTEPTSEIMERNTSILTAAGDEDGDEKVELQQMSPSDEQQNLQMPGEIQQEQEEKQQYSRQLRRDDSTTSTDPASDDMDNRGERSLSAPLTPPLQVSTRPFSMSLSTKNMKQVVFEANSGETDLVSLKEGGRDSASSSSDFSSTPERHYFGQIKKCIASIEDLMDSSRKLEIRIREKQAKGATQSS